jgi:hypothetical protein
VCLLHAIGRSDGPGCTNQWLAKYIFPGGYSPAVSEVLPAIEATGLIVTDVEILRLHYAMTLRHWRRRFAANRDAILSLYDERFCRMFEFYLAGSELAFHHQFHMNFQTPDHPRPESGSAHARLHAGSRTRSGQTCVGPGGVAPAALCARSLICWLIPPRHESGAAGGRWRGR